MPWAGDELPVHIGRIALPLRRVRRGFYYFRLCEGPRTPPASILTTAARNLGHSNHTPGAGCATPTHAARYRYRELA